MRQAIGIVLSLVTLLACLVFIALSVIGMFNETTQTVVIGPHAPETWTEGRVLTAEGDIFLKASHGVTITQDDDTFVTATIPGKIPAGEKLPTFTSQFSADPAIRYHTNDSVEIYSDQEVKVTFRWYPISENFVSIFLYLVLTYMLMRLFEKLFDL